MKLKKVLIVAVLSTVAFTSCQDNNRRDGENERVEMDRLEADREAEMRANEQRLDRESNSITARIEDNRELSTFSQGMNNAQVSNSYRQEEGPFTIFAPANSAYEQLDQTERDQMMDVQNRDRNNASMHYLMVEGRVTEDQLRQEIQNANGNYTLTTLQGEDLTATMEGEDIVLRDGSGNQARITQSDTDASNGVVHVIDGVLKPQDPNRNEAASRMRNNNNINNTGDNTNLNNNNNLNTSTNIDNRNNTGTGTNNDQRDNQ